MRTTWLKVWIWIKVWTAALLLIYLLVFVYKNSKQEVTFWVWWNTEPRTTALLLAFFSFVAGGLSFWVMRTAFQTIRQVKELQQRNRQERTEKQIAEMHAKAATLQTKPSPSEELPPIA
jgi:uncharacterized integral membrane protein